MTPRLQAIVDCLGPSFDGHGFWWRVEVWEAFPSTVRRIYRLRSVSDNLAAQEGLRRLTVELERSPITVH